MPTVKEYMSEATHSVSPDDTLQTASELMMLHGVRHLPVIAEGKAVSLISMSDLYVLDTQMGADFDRQKVGDSMMQDVYWVTPDTPLVDAVRRMAKDRIGSAIVVDVGGLVGMFTATDAVRVLAEMLEEG